MRLLLIGLGCVALAGCSEPPPSYCEPWSTFSVPPPEHVAWCRDGGLKFDGTLASFEALEAWLAPVSIVRSHVAAESVSGKKELEGRALNVGLDTLEAQFVKETAPAGQWSGLCDNPAFPPPTEHAGCFLTPTTQVLLSAKDAAIAREAQRALLELKKASTRYAGAVLAGRSVPATCDFAALSARDPAVAAPLISLQLGGELPLPGAVSTGFDADTVTWARLVRAWGSQKERKLVLGYRLRNHRPAAHSAPSVLGPAFKAGSVRLEFGVIDLRDGNVLCGRSATVTNSAMLTVRWSSEGSGGETLAEVSQRDLQANALEDMQRVLREQHPSLRVALWPSSP